MSFASNPAPRRSADGETRSAPGSLRLMHRASQATGRRAEMSEAIDILRAILAPG